MRPRTCVSAISTFNLALDEDLAFWERHHIDTVGVSVAKLERFGWDKGTRLVSDAVASGLRVANLIGLGPFNLADPASWPKQQDRLVHSIDTAAEVGAECMVFTTGPFGHRRGKTPPTISKPARPGAASGQSARHPLRDRAHQLPSGRRRLRAHPEGRR